jgi:2-keto-4-pentenoate hydratase/2-oxohepta-3-ene-1,7-dioic acid hydratase in catechol pathway
MDHIREADIGVPDLATMFCKYPSSIIGSGEDIRWSTALTDQVDYEAELAVVIGKTARHVDAEIAYEYVAGYMNCNDVSARDLQFKPGDQWLRGKCPCSSNPATSGYAANAWTAFARLAPTWSLAMKSKTLSGYRSSAA